MSTEQGLALRRQLTPDVYSMIDLIAPVMHQARFFGVASKEQAAAVMIKGFELGLPLAASFEFIHIVEGRPSLSPRGALALIYGSGELLGLKIEDFDGGCRTSMKRRNGVEHSITWTMEDAKRAGLIKDKGNWEKYGPNMCRWRSIGFCSDVVFPDVLGGLKRADEFGAPIDDNGNVVDGQWPEAPSLQEQADADQAAFEVLRTAPPTLDDLVARYGAEAVIVAGEGQIPGTDEELAAVAARLASNAPS